MPVRKGIRLLLLCSATPSVSPVYFLMTCPPPRLLCQEYPISSFLRGSEGRRCWFVRQAARVAVVFSEVLSSSRQTSPPCLGGKSSFLYVSPPCRERGERGGLSPVWLPREKAVLFSVQTQHQDCCCKKALAPNVV